MLIEVEVEAQVSDVETPTDSGPHKPPDKRCLLSLKELKEFATASNSVEQFTKLVNEAERKEES